MADRDAKGRWLVGHGEPGPGRKSAYDESWMPEQAFRLTLLGLNDEQLASAFGIHPGTFYDWKRRHTAFSEAILAGGERADADVAHALYHRAKGVTVVSEKAFKNKEGEVVVAQTKTQLPADVRAAEIWLRNRQRKRWRKEDEATPPGTIEDPDAVTDARDLEDRKLAARIAELERRRAHGMGDK